MFFYKSHNINFKYLKVRKLKFAKLEKISYKNRKDGDRIRTYEVKTEDLQSSPFVHLGTLGETIDYD